MNHGADALPPPPAESLHQLYSDHHGWLTGWLRRRLGCPQNSADLAQDTFLRVLLAREKPTILEPFAFLTTVAKRVLANHYRRQDIERAYLQALAALPEAEAPSEEERAIILAIPVELDRLLDGLPLGRSPYTSLGRGNESPALPVAARRISRMKLIA